jgi:hypothetical protein
MQIIILVIFSLFLSSELMAYSYDSYNKELVLKIEDQVEKNIKDAVIQDINHYDDNLLEVIISRKDEKDRNILYYVVSKDALLMGSIFKDAKNLTREKWLKINELNISSSKKSLSVEGNSTKELDAIKEILKKEKEKYRNKIVEKYSSNPQKLIETIRDNGFYTILNKDGKKGQLLLVMDLDCGGCKKTVKEKKIEQLIDNDFSVVLYISTQKNDDKQKIRKSFLLNSMDDKMSTQNKIEYINKMFFGKGVVSKSEIAKEYREYLKNRDEIVSKKLIKGFPAVIVLNVFGDKFFFHKGEISE